ncbi:hypothetical protein [Tropicibacter oceani]|uniref:Uncharacterized protein n=1 Tax=Tropicibacter oceani TaxID=3058420 RepID=A0ABY8QMI6_9RHOB|nr:hypothetical protein [Tropicibacter oceani]WGW05755.1 hypothetical protein QF118_09475 [Tropicibacter oceani]
MSQGQTGPKPAAEAVTLPQRRVVLECAAYLARVLPSEMERGPEGLLCTNGTSVFESGCAALGALGILGATEHPALWSQQVPQDRIAPHLEARPLLRRHFDRTLQAFIDHAAGHAGTLPDTRAGFVMPDLHARQGAALLRAGYLVADGGHVIWSEQIGPYMQEAILWDAKGQCLSEIWVAQEEAEARHFLAALPDRLRDDLRRTVLARGGLAGIDLLKRHWTPAGWTVLRQARPGDLTEAGFRVNVFTTIVRLIREGRA